MFDPGDTFLYNAFPNCNGILFVEEEEGTPIEISFPLSTLSCLTRRKFSGIPLEKAISPSAKTEEVCSVAEPVKRLLDDMKSYALRPTDTPT